MALTETERDVLSQAQQDSRTLIRVEAGQVSIEKRLEALEEGQDQIRANQGRTFIASLVAATAGIVAILTLVLTASGSL